MAEIKPFKAVHYNNQKVPDLAKVVCPPYDVISKARQDFYYGQSEHNFIRVLLGKDKAGDTAQDNKYTRAKKNFDQWLKEGVLVEDDKPSIYYYRQEYRMLGQKYNRLGFLALLKLSDEKDSKIFPHENTHAAAKEDRIKLWKALSSNCSPIFVCFSDAEKRIETIFKKDVSTTEPMMDIKDDDGIRHLLWRMSDPARVREVMDTLSGERLFIADGHHRYEVSLEYRRFKLAALEKSTGKEPFQYVMTYFTNMNSKDLQILPLHRVVKHFSKHLKNLEFLEEFFRIDKIKPEDNLMIILARAGQNEHAFGLYTKNGTMLLRLKNKSIIDKYATEGSQAYRRLDASILKAFVFDRVGIQSEDIVYTHDLNQAKAMVDEGKADVAFLMNPVRMQQLQEIALNGERMPPKTTYFYPKVLSGLTVHKME